VNLAYEASNYKGIKCEVDHVAKFCGDRPTELGDPVAN